MSDHDHAPIEDSSFSNPQVQAAVAAAQAQAQQRRQPQQQQHHQPEQPPVEHPPLKLPVDASLPALSMEEKSCRSCEYYAFDDETERTHAAAGECRRHAPFPGPLSNAHWPVVPWKSWCGEWENGVSNEDMVRMARAIGENIGKEDF